MFSPPSLIVGLDLGQMHDPTALSIVHREMLLRGAHLEARFGLRALQRIPLGTAYPKMVREVREYLDTQLSLPYVLVIDVTGVGRGPYDLFRDVPEELLRQPWAMQQLPASYRPIAVTLTTGQQTTTETVNEWHVPKRDVVLGLQITMQQGRLQMARALPEAPTLVKEIQNFQWKVSKSLQDQYGAWREGQHDDLLLATAIAVWYGERTAPVTPPEYQQTHAQHTRNPLLAPAGSVMQTHAAVSGRRW